MVDWTELASRASGGGGASSGGSPGSSGFFSGSGSAMDSQIPMVYRGKGTTSNPAAGVGGTRPASDRGFSSPTGGSRPSGERPGFPRQNLSGTREKSIYDPADEVAASFYDMDDDARAEWGDYLVKIGLIDPEDADNFEVLQQFWDKGVELSSAFTARGKDVTVQDALATYAGWDGSGESAAARARAAKQAESEPFSGTRTQRTESINLSDPASAKNLANYVLSKALGREALPSEFAQYREALNAYEKQNPQVSTTTATYEEGIQTDQKTVTKGGATSAGAEQTLTDLAREEDDYAEYQAAGPIWNSMLAALASPVSLG